MALELKQKLYIIRKGWKSATHGTFSVMGLEITKVNKKSYTAKNLTPKQFERPSYNIVERQEGIVSLTLNNETCIVYNSFEEALKESKKIKYSEEKEKLELEKEGINIRLKKLVEQKTEVEKKIKELEESNERNQNA